MEKYNPCMTVRELIKSLSGLDQNMLVGCHGHFGEFYEITENNIGVDFSYRVPIGETWRSTDDRAKISHLVITLPDIGPEPD